MSKETLNNCFNCHGKCEEVQECQLFKTGTEYPYKGVKFVKNWLLRNEVWNLKYHQRIDGANKILYKNKNINYVRINYENSIGDIVPMVVDRKGLHRLKDWELSNKKPLAIR